MIKYIWKNPEWIYRILLFIGVMGGLFLNSHYVTIDQHTKDVNNIVLHQDSLNDRMAKIETAILLMAEQNKVNDRQDKELADHETRLRLLEKASERKSP